MSYQRLILQQTNEKLGSLKKSVSELYSSLKDIIATGPIVPQSDRLHALSLLTIASNLLEDAELSTGWLSVRSGSDVILVDKEAVDVAVRMHCARVEALGPLFVELSSALVLTAEDLLNKAKARLDKVAALTAADLFMSAVSEVSHLYYVRLVNASFNITSAVPGVKILAQQGDLYYVEVPDASHAIFQTLEAEGQLPGTTIEEARVLREIAEKSSVVV